MKITFHILHLTTRFTRVKIVLILSYILYYFYTELQDLFMPVLFNI